MRKKIIPFISVVVIVIVIFCAVMFTGKVETKIITFKKNYDISSYVDGSNKFMIDFLINDKKSYMIDKTQVEECYLTNKGNDSVLNLDLLEIKDNESNLKYNKDIYYNYSYVLNVNLKIDSFYTWSIKDAYLVIKYSGNKVYNLSIGNVSYNKIEKKDNETFTITNIKALTSLKEDNTYLSGIMIGIRSVINESFNLTNINILNSSVKCGKEIKEIEKIVETNDFKDVAGYEFSEVVEGDGSVNSIINDNKVHYFFIPLYYKEDYLINKFPLEFIIDNNGQVIHEYLVNYVYYEVQTENISKRDINIYDVK